MAAEIEVYKGTARSYFGSFSLEYLIAQGLSDGIDAQFLEALRAPLGPGPTRLHMEFVEPDPDADDAWDSSRLELLDLRRDSNRVSISAWTGGELIHKRTYSVRDLFGRTLVRLLRRIDPEERHWAYVVRSSARGLGGPDEGSRIRPTPSVIGGIDVDLGHRQRRVPFEVRQVPSPRTDAVDPERLGLDPDRLGEVNVLLHERIDELLRSDLPFSAEIEEGGFLLGRIRTAGDASGIVFAEITNVTPATRSGASAVHFTFTADSFHEVNAHIRKEEGEELVGWYHSHLFAHSVEMGTGIGLSSIDVDTHLSTFRRPGQVAGLLNITDQGRALRFYGSVGDVLEECPLWIYDERGRYRFARPELGDR